ncbi:MAG TPA: OmpA family protein [Rhizomicrobium sp.]
MTMTIGAARAGGDCAPLGHLPILQATRDAVITPFDKHDFNVTTNGETAPVTVAGKTCDQAYSLKPGTPDTEDLKIETAYRALLAPLGAQIVFADNNNTVAKIVKGGGETWISVYSLFADVHVYVLTKSAPVQSLLPPSGADYRLIGHMPNYVAGKPEKSPNDKFVYRTDVGKDPRMVTVTGATYKLTYTIRPGADTESSVAIQANYRTALKALNAQILFTDDNTTTARLEDKGQTIWIGVYNLFDEIRINVVEEAPPRPATQPPADSMKAALDQAGHLALYINFDFNKATLKPDAAAVIAQIATLLKKNPALNVSLQGHTDNVGTHDYNLKLSQECAASVVAAIVKSGIDGKRLTSTGFGPDKPIADNNTPDGRAKNRRVELVKG